MVPMDYQPNSEIQRKTFEELTAEQLAGVEPFNLDTAPFPYFPEAATFYYPKKPITEAVETLPDDEGFFSFVTEQVGNSISPESITALVDALNARFKEKNLRIVFADHNKKEPEIYCEGSKYNNPLSDEDRGQYYSSTWWFYDVDDIEKPTRVNYLYRGPIPSCTRLIIVDKKTVQEEPEMAIATIAHEYGHELEHRQSKMQNIDGEESFVSPATEVISTACGYKMSKIFFEKTGNSKFIEGGMRNLRTYNQVIFGNVEGNVQAVTGR